MNTLPVIKDDIKGMKQSNKFTDIFADELDDIVFCFTGPFAGVVNSWMPENWLYPSVFMLETFTMYSVLGCRFMRSAFPYQSAFSSLVAVTSTSLQSVESCAMNCTLNIVMGVSLCAVHSICKDCGEDLSGVFRIRASSAYPANIEN